MIIAKQNIRMAAFALVLGFATSLHAAPVNTAPDAVPANAANTQFTTTISDLPLMPGLKTVADKDVLFDTSAGRIAETTAAGSVAVADVYKFYHGSLPQLGWKAAGAHRWQRGAEQLRIEASDASGVTTVTFSVEPEAHK